MINFIMWLLFGALVGWIASMIMKTNAEQGAIANIVIGIVGAFIGGWLARTFIGSDVTGFNLSSLLIAVVGAVLLIGLINLVRGKPVRE